MRRPKPSKRVTRLSNFHAEYKNPDNHLQAQRFHIREGFNQRRSAALSEHTRNYSKNKHVAKVHNDLANAHNDAADYHNAMKDYHENLHSNPPRKSASRIKAAVEPSDAFGDQA